MNISVQVTCDTVGSHWLVFCVYFQESFGDLALFFCDPYGGTVIAVLWKPKAFIPTPFKVCPKSLISSVLKY